MRVQRPPVLSFMCQGDAKYICRGVLYGESVFLYYGSFKCSDRIQTT